jgi:hypothetical protein
MDTIPYEDAYKIIDDMRELSDNDREDVSLYAATLPASVISELTMLFHFGLAVSRSLDRDAIERLVFQLLDHEAVYTELFLSSYTADFYRVDYGRARITDMLRPYKDGVPVKLVVALILVFSATYARTTIPKLLGIQGED